VDDGLSEHKPATNPPNLPAIHADGKNANGNKKQKRKDQERLRTRNRIRQAPGRKKLRITAMAARRIDLTRPVAGSPPCRRGGEREALELDWNFPPSPPGSLVLTSCPLGAQQSTHTGLRRPEWNRTRLAPCRERRIGQPSVAGF
jgi:hypothetical protein